MAEDFLASGIQAAKAGDIAQARTLFTQTIKQDPNSARAWICLGRVLEDPEKKKYCFDRAIQLDPDLAKRFSPQPAKPDQPTPPPETPVIKSQVASQPDKKEPRASTPAPQKQSRPKPPAPSAKPSRLLVPLLGMLSACVLIGLLTALCVYSGKLGTFLPVNAPAPAAAAKLPVVDAIPTVSDPSAHLLEPTYTPRPTLTIAPSRTPDAVQRQQAADQLSRQALNLMYQKSYADAIVIWDKLIAQAPDYGEAYYQRALTYIDLTESLRAQTEYVDYLDRAMADLDRAIAIGPATGNYFATRSTAYQMLAGNSPYRVDKDWIYPVALDNIRTGLALGTNIEWADREVPGLLNYMGKCDEGLVEVNKLFQAQSPSAPPSAGLNTIMAESYLCLGEYEKALEHINKALELVPTSVRFVDKVEILYSLGRLEEARKLISERIDRSPSFGGYRYYLRALIEYDLGLKDKAKEDLDIGSGNTWGHEGIYSYLLGLFALDSGDKTEAIMQFQYAEATLPRDTSPVIFRRVLRSLAEVGAQPLSPEPQVSINATPISPDVLQRLTPGAQTPTPAVLANQQTPIPTPGSVESVLAAADQAIQNGDLDSAKYLLTSLLDRQLDNATKPHIYQTIGDMEISQSHFRLAAGYYEHLYSLQRTPEILAKLAGIHAAGGELEIAEKRFQELLDWPGSVADPYREEARFALESVRQMLGKPVPNP